MARNRRNRKGSNRRADRVLGSNATPAMPVLSLSPSEAFERMLGHTNDSCVLRGKLVLSSGGSLTPIEVLDINPINFGTRAAAAQQIFARFRVKGINVRFSATNSTGTNTCALGFKDDPSQGSPAGMSDVLELRSSALFLAGSTIPSNILYQPVDKTKWYNTSRNGDVREWKPSELWFASQAGAGVALTCEIDYSFVFAGALDYDGGA